MLPKLSCALAALLAVAQAQPPQPHKPGVTTPGVQVPIEQLKPEAIYAVPGAPDWIAVGDEVWISNKPKDVVIRIDPNTNNVAATIAVGKRPCSGLAIGFDSLWVPLCGDQTTAQGLARVDLKTGNVSATISITIGNTEGGIAIGASSVWLMTDKRGTLARIDPDTSTVVAEIVVPVGSYAVAFGEKAVWVTNTDSNTLTRVDPETNLVAETIPVGKKPRFLAVGEGSVWTLNQEDGSVTRVDAKTNKVVATIPVGIPGSGGDIAIGAGSVWTTSFGFPISRIDPSTNKVVQQFVGKGGDAIRIGLGSVWLSNLEAGTVWRLDPKRIEATVAF